MCIDDIIRMSDDLLDIIDGTYPRAPETSGCQFCNPEPDVHLITDADLEHAAEKLSAWTDIDLPASLLLDLLSGGER